MNSKGHAGLNMATLSALGLLLKIEDPYFNLIIILSTALVSLPDIDLRLEIAHRKYTHNIFLAVIVAFLAGLLTMHLIGDFELGFISMLTAFLTHILGDLMTYRPFNPLAPLTKGNYSLKLFRSNNPAVNNTVLLVGVLTYALYLAKILGISW